MQTITPHLPWSYFRDKLIISATDFAAAVGASAEEPFLVVIDEYDNLSGEQNKPFARVIPHSTRALTFSHFRHVFCGR
jgi:hypothetical protein